MSKDENGSLAGAVEVVARVFLCVEYFKFST